MKKESKIFFVILTVFLMLTVLSASIAVPIVCRPFYYAHVKQLDLPGQTPWTYEEICDAYDEMLDFCIYGSPFGTGVLRWSEEGMHHFADCAVLFRLDFAVLLFSLLGLLICYCVYRHGCQPARLLNRGPAFWSGLLLLLFFFVVAGIGALNFDALFVAFHQIFFPGKSNWIFDPSKDQIIEVMPEVFFRNCGILIVALIFAGCIALMLWDRWSRNRRKAS